jgi:hypothetical protein
MAVVMARKKGWARHGDRVVKRNVASPNAIRRDEIVEEVVDNLWPRKSHRSPFMVAGFGNWFRDRCDEAARTA